MPPKKDAGLATHQGKRAIDRIRSRYMGDKKCITVPE
ncbi:hypothetical protein LCGC14_2849640, partial [marine sediment metagenome]